MSELAETIQFLRRESVAIRDEDGRKSGKSVGTDKLIESYSARSNIYPVIDRSPVGRFGTPYRSCFARKCHAVSGRSPRRSNDIIVLQREDLTVVVKISNGIDAHVERDRL